MKDNEGTIYQDNSLESLTNQYWRLQRLAEEGWNVTPLMEDVWGQITNIINGEEQKQLTGLRARIKEIVKEKKETVSGGFNTEGKI